MMSTACPLFPTNEALSFSADPAEMRSVAHLLEESNYKSVPVYPGDIIFFRQSTPHFGVANTMQQGNRVMLFSVLSPTAEQGQDAFQVFPWLYHGKAFGYDSFEFAKALVEGRAHDPVIRIGRDEGAARAEEARKCLRAWDLLEQYKQA